MWISPPYSQDPRQRPDRDAGSTTFLHPHHSSPLKHISSLPTSAFSSRLKVSLVLLTEGKATHFQPISILLGSSSPPASRVSYLQWKHDSSVLSGSTVLQGFRLNECDWQFHRAWPSQVSPSILCLPTAQNAWHVLCLTFSLSVSVSLPLPLVLPPLSSLSSYINSYIPSSIISPVVFL